MKKLCLSAAALLLIASILFAGNQYSRDLVALTTTSGMATYTNSSTYMAKILKNIYIETSLSSGSTVNVTRVTCTNSTITAAYTDTVAVIVCSSGRGSQNLMWKTNTVAGADVTNPACIYMYPVSWYMLSGDKLVFTNTPATGATVRLEYEVQSLGL